MHVPPLNSYYLNGLNLNVGFGATLRGSMIGTLYSALTSNRVFLLDPPTFHFGGCDSQSWSCYFQDLSNCTLRDAQSVANHPHTEEPLPLTREPRQHTNASLAVYKGQHEWAPIEVFLPNTGPLPHFPMLSHDDIAAGLLMYLLRPTANTRERAEAILRESLPCGFDPEAAISMPIRASDKCRDPYGGGPESTCPTLDAYLALADVLREWDPRLRYLILTSEDPEYVANITQHAGKGWEFVINPYDRMPAVGGPEFLIPPRPGQPSVDEQFMSFFTSLHLQLRGRYFLLNCASNFHRVLAHLVKGGGCSLARRPVVLCLDEQFGEYGICQNYMKPGECRAKMKAALRRKLAGV
jgi:hypothetical protein